MKVVCFGCERVIEANDLEALSDAFVAHGKARHSWEYPEEAVRNYACNYADAVERLSDNVERLSKIADIVVYPVTDDRVHDWLQLFDCDGFAGNPGWASCYCLEPHLTTTPENPERPWRESRRIMVERLQKGTTFGYLAYVDDKVAGWVNASLRADYGMYRLVDPGGPEPSSVIGVSCFVVAPPYRRHGVASALLDRVIADAAERGVSWIEAYPHNEPEKNDAGHFRGPRTMFDSRGFVVVVTREHDSVMRRRV